ncbi:hypothetical protein [Burkholderia sp. Ac-20379]|uniref:hypothetical protein n=1 Tax=Burkholderia sp. Ac-20379 TaxID=2703900 RepID=UPI001980A088|nr:hypothetical protein [Burkholderia sp. Ac-20379]MBN3725842.1 hypothetical protein [Burkholderia sp. Ac-20379]
MPNTHIPIAGDLALPGWHALRTVTFGGAWALAGHAADPHPSFVRATCRAAFASFVGAANRSQPATNAAPMAFHRAPGGISPREKRLAACWTIGALGVLGGLVFGTLRSNEKPLEYVVPVQPVATSAKPLAALAAVTTPSERGKAAPSAKVASVKPDTPAHTAPAKKAPTHKPSHAVSHHAKPHHAAAAHPKRSYAVPLAGKALEKQRAHRAAHAPGVASPQGDARAMHDREALRVQRWHEIGAMQGAAPHRANVSSAQRSANVSNNGQPHTANPQPAAAQTFLHPVSRPRPAPRIAQLAQLNEPHRSTPHVQERLAPLQSQTPAILVATPGTSVPAVVQAPAAATSGHIEIVIGKATVRIEGDVDPIVLRHVLEALPA